VGYYNAGIPNYEHLFGRDSSITALALLHRDPKVAKATLETLAKYQGRHQKLRREEYPGRILHEHYPGGWREKLHDFMSEGDRLRQISTYILWRFPYYGSIDAGAWFIILLHHYYHATGDRELVEQLWPSVEAIVDWLDKHATHSHTGLVGFKKHYIFGLRNQSWKDNLNLKLKPPVAMIEIQGYYYYGFNLAAELAAEVIKDSATATALRARATSLQERFRKAFVPVDGSYPLAVDGRGRPYSHATSNPGHLLFTGILDKKESAMVVERLMRDDLLTEYGIRTESTNETTFVPSSYQNGSVWPFDNWTIYQGMIKYGYKNEAKRLRDGTIKVFDRWNELPELYAVEVDGSIHTVKSACRIQAWSAGALINWLDEAPVI
jgi:glycogen debranching enzyme